MYFHTHNYIKTTDDPSRQKLIVLAWSDRACPSPLDGL